MLAMLKFELVLVEAPAQALILAPTRELAVQIADMSRAVWSPGKFGTVAGIGVSTNPPLGRRTSGRRWRFCCFDLPTEAFGY